MEANYRTIHQEWAILLINRGLSQTVYLILAAFRPLTLISAQLVFTGKPLLSKFISETNIDAAGSLLDDPDEMDQFMQLLDSKVQHP